MAYEALYNSDDPEEMAELAARRKEDAAEAAADNIIAKKWDLYVKQFRATVAVQKVVDKVALYISQGDCFLPVFKFDFGYGGMDAFPAQRLADALQIYNDEVDKIWCDAVSEAQQTRDDPWETKVAELQRDILLAIAALRCVELRRAVLTAARAHC